MFWAGPGSTVYSGGLYNTDSETVTSDYVLGL